MDDEIDIAEATGETAPEQLQRLRDSGVPVLFKPVEPVLLLQALSTIARP